MDPYVPSDSRNKERVGSFGTPDETALLHQVVGPSGGVHLQPGFTLCTLQLQVIRFMVINVPGCGRSLFPPGDPNGSFAGLVMLMDEEFVMLIEDNDTV